MKVRLNVPYEQKDVAKKLGASWDAVNRYWYVEDVTNLIPYMRWIDKRLLEPTKSVPLVHPPHTRPLTKKQRGGYKRPK